MTRSRDFQHVLTEVTCGSQLLHLHSLFSEGIETAKPPFVLVPGLGASARSMLPTARLLSPARAVHVIDLPAQGGSDRPKRIPDLPGYAATISAWAQSLEIARAVWVGHSFGAQVLVDLAILQSNVVDRLALVSLTVDPRERTLIRALAGLLVDATREPPELRRLLIGDYLRTGPRTLLEIGGIALGDPIEKKLPLIHAPTLFVSGERDPLVSESWTEEMVKLLPRAMHVAIPNAPHAVPYVSPDRLVLVIDELLSKPTMVPA